jgi:cytochrome c oxidase subunit 3
MISNINHSGKQYHPYHLVTPSPWPLAISMTASLIPIGAVQYMHSYQGGLTSLLFGLFSTIAIMIIWWRDVIREATFEGMHTTVVQRGLRLGFVLFVVSEVMLFFAFFWAFFHSSLAPTIEIGSIWPPAGIVTFDPWGVPLLNTLILLLSGVTITIVHHSIINGDALTAKYNFLATIGLAFLFTSFQVFEYIESPFSISDGVYGSTFFMATGFHGAHVIIGTLFITVCFVRLIYSHFTRQHHVGFEAAAWYWHFVDVVWLFLFVSIYWWGSQ